MQSLEYGLQRVHIDVGVDVGMIVHLGYGRPNTVLGDSHLSSSVWLT